METCRSVDSFVGASQPALGRPLHRGLYCVILFVASDPPSTIRSVSYISRPLRGALYCTFDQSLYEGLDFFRSVGPLVNACTALPISRPIH